ncbi:MAG TPA: phage minor capsid protein, partial [Phytomonospora sp.]
SKRRDARLHEAVDHLRSDLPGIDALMGLAQELNQRMSSTHLHVLRWQADAYREVMAQPAADVLLGTKSRLRAAQVAWEHLLSKGVTGFTDKRNRHWELASYVEMATRTTVAHAALEGALDRFRQAGVDLVLVSDAPQECPRCRPWEHQVLAIAGPATPRQVEHGLQDGVMVTVDPAGTLAQAVAAGLMHPNCRHSLAAYIPGVTKRFVHTQDPQGDKARQRLRELERRLRKAKVKREAAIDPAAAKALGQRVRAIQAQIRDHVNTTSAKRQPQREHIGTAR